MYVFFQSLNSCLTDNTAKTLCCLPTTRRRGRRQTDGKRQRNAKINGRGMRKWVGTAGSPGTGSRKKLSNFRKQTFIQVYKYIQPCLSKTYRSWKGREQRETGIKHGCGELKKRNAGTEDYWSWRELQKLNAKEKNKSGNAEREMQKWNTNAENEWRKICRIQI